MGISLAGKAGYIAFGRSLASLSTIIAGAILSRYLSKEAYGTYRQLWLVYNTLSPLVTLGIPTSVNYFVPQLKNPERKAFTIQTFSVLTMGGVIMSIVFFYGSPLIAKIFHNPELMPVARLFSLIPVLTLPTFYYQNLFICIDQPLLAAGLSGGLALGKLLAVGIPAIIGSGLKGILIGLIVFSSIQLSIVTYFIFRPFTFYNTNWKPTLLKQQFLYALPIGMASIVGVLTLQLDKIVISSFFTASQYATYTNGAIEIPLIGIITGSVTAVLMPEFVKLNANGRRDHLVVLWHRAIRKVALIILPVMIFLFIYAPEFLTILFSTKYSDSAAVFRVYLMALPNRVTTFGAILLSMGFSSLVMRYAVYTLILNVGLNLLLVKSLGFLGPAIGTVIAIYFIAYLQLRKIALLMENTFTSIFPWYVLGKIMLVALATGVISSWPKLFNLHLSALSAFVCGSITYVTLFIQGGVRSKIFSVAELKAIFQEVLHKWS